MKIYLKMGKKSYKESRMIQALEPALNEKFAADPQFQSNFVPAKNFDELKRLYEAHCTEDADFVVSEQSSSTSQSATSTEATEPAEKERFIDPLNREEPKVRDYVMKDEFTNTENTSAKPKNDFAEPQSFEDSFAMPDADTPKTNQKQKTHESKQQSERSSAPKQEPMNPEFDSMSAGKKKRSTRKFAKYIVETVCMLAEKGFVWFANKDINEGKLAEYEISGEVELDLLVTMEEGQQVTVKQFFLSKCHEAEALAKIDPEEKNDLIDALAEVMLEKGVGPTPQQELMLITAKVFGGQVLALLQLRGQTNAVLNQLRAMKQEGYAEYEEQPEPPKQQQKPEPVKQTHSEPEPATVEPTQVAEAVVENDLPIIDNPVTTIE